MPSYIILSLKHSTSKEAVFWRPDNAGYTGIPWAAGVYSHEAVTNDPSYYNDGYNAIAIPLTEKAIEASGLKFSINLKKLKAFYSGNKRKEVSHA